jgi:hypothetical protein
MDPGSMTNPKLDFERVQTESGAKAGPLACVGCKRQIAGQYFTAGKAILCDACRHSFEMGRSELSAARPLARAAAFGLAAALAGAALWGGVIWLTGYELGLIAVVVGVMVGKAVRRGSGGVGGRPYQVVAVLLTYLAVTLAYVPLVIQGFRQAQNEQTAAQPETPDPARPALAAEAADAPEAPAGEAVEPDAGPTPGGVALAGLAILAFAAAVPFLAGAENAIGLLIIGFALWEAWKMNSALDLTVRGPFQVGSAAGA